MPRSICSADAAHIQSLAAPLPSTSNPHMSHSQQTDVVPASSSDSPVAAVASQREEPRTDPAADGCVGQLPSCSGGVASAKTSLSKSPDAARSDVAAGGGSVSKAVSECSEDRGSVAGKCVSDDAVEGSKSRVAPKHGSEGQSRDLGKLKGRERKNFSKKVVDELQSWFYSNISHPYASPPLLHSQALNPAPAFLLLLPSTRVH